MCLIFAIGYYTVYGPMGIKKYKHLGKQIAKESHKITQLKAEVDALKYKIKLWENDPFEKEKVGRTDLQLACTNEIIYLLPTQ